MTVKRKFWNWVRNEGERRTLLLDGEISDETWFGDEVTSAIFREELHAVEGDVVLWINLPGGANLQHDDGLFGQSHGQD